MCGLGLSIMSQKLMRKLFCPILLAIAATVAEGTLESLWSEGRQIASGKNLGYNDGLNWW